MVLLLDGDDWLYLHPAVTAFDAAVAAGDMPPVTLVFLLGQGPRGRVHLPPRAVGGGPGRTAASGRRVGRRRAAWSGWWSPGRAWAV